MHLAFGSDDEITQVLPTQLGRLRNLMSQYDVMGSKKESGRLSVLKVPTLFRKLTGSPCEVGDV